jgi:hypothetical protein
MKNSSQNRTTYITRVHNDLNKYWQSQEERVVQNLEYFSRAPLKMSYGNVIPTKTSDFLLMFRFKVVI